MAGRSDTTTFLDSHLSENRRIVLEKFWEQLIGVAGDIRRNRTAFAALIVLTTFVVVAVFAPYIAPYEPMAYHDSPDGTAMGMEPPSSTHIFGTTSLGQDVFSQWVFAARASLLVGFLSGLSVTVIGVTVGLVAGYYKGTVDLVLMRVVDVLYGIPATPLILIVAMFFGSSLWTVIIAMVLILWRTMARVIRSQTLSLAERPFVKAARASGASDLRIIFIHIAPNLLPLIFIQGTLAVGTAILLEAGVSFLGIGAELSWGSMLQMTFATGAIRYAPWWVFPPGIALTLLIMSLFFLSRAIEDIAQPEMRSVK
ncbi:ABC transporter permease [Natrononativus amylolyticus]|uniref:ABC transporter permease n=1 Tax=Natrononativus amylolyticus TaxID=2963434 RepID=UPI0020CC231F|nr:ABC transporter permease [Natrononativus amylolyticus]